ncbi:MAG TPA: CpsB/CapC family capsule biosynthesis tyrosine phosphatase [Candidatus Acidoferrales bacterium]|jgi:protein-tyrosine phosphatase|nr:CpsB/CapC family capsule biosynthesis tyrosine phosphatase [Candidatus Acidoferrales bacterium]
MIDIHSHILPCLDDGSHSPEESVAMLRMAAAAGTTDIVATPHANHEFRFDPALVEREIAGLQAAIGATPQIHYGCDFQLTPDNIEDAIRSPGKYSINHRGYLLVEFSDFLIPKTTSEIFAQLMRAGLCPIVTHPERNQLLRSRLKELAEWVEEGALIQVTAQSMLGLFGKSARTAAHELMRMGLVHFLASDAHDLEHRTTALDAAWRYVEADFGKEAAVRILEENPRAVLAGVGLNPAPYALKKKWFGLW